MGAGVKAADWSANGSANARCRPLAVSPPTTKTWSSAARSPRTGSTAGSNGAETNSACAPRILQDVTVLLAVEQRVDRDRYDAGLDGAPENDGEVYRVEDDQSDPSLAADAVGGQQVAHAAAVVGQIAVGERTLRIHEGDLVAPSLLDVAFDEIGRRVVMAGNIFHGAGVVYALK